MRDLFCLALGAGLGWFLLCREVHHRHVLVLRDQPARW